MTARAAAAHEAVEAATDDASAPAAAALQVARQPARDASKPHVFELLDTVFTAFASTNVHRGRHYTLPELFRVHHEATFRFHHRAVPYVATVRPSDGHDAPWLNVKLCNDGFGFPRRDCDRQGRAPRLVPEGWIALPEREYSPYFLGLRAALRPFYDSMQAFYNFSEQRFDIRLYPRSDASRGTPHLLVTYEPGPPEMDTTVPKHPV